MKLYYDPLSTTSRPVVLFLLDHDIPVELEVIELFAGQNHAPDYVRVNPNQIVPFLVDGDLAIGESSAILKYLADKAGSPAYPSELKARARVNEAMDWFNTQFRRDFNMCLIYPQVLPPGHVPDVDPRWGPEASRRWLTILDRHMIGENAYVCGPHITLADYLGIAFVTLGELIDFDVSPWPNVARWIARMKAQPGWAATYAGFNGWIASRVQAAE